MNETFLDEYRHEIESILNDFFMEHDVAISIDEEQFFIALTEGTHVFEELLTDVLVEQDTYIHDEILDLIEKIENLYHNEF